jgi:class 3 adenylate cyclase
MEATNSGYDHVASDTRIQQILNSSESFDEVKEIPTRSKLTYSNGYYVDCTALFIDIRDSSKLPENHNRPVLGKLYRAYLSECVAVINSDLNCREVFINGDCVSGILNSPYTSDIDRAFSTAAKLNSMTQILNWRLEKKGYAQFRCGIGIAFGRALMLKAGFSGSGLNEVIWMGDVVNEASNLCHQGNRAGSAVLQVSTTVYSNLNDHNKGLLSPRPNPYYPTQYEGNVINTDMDKWLTEEKEKSRKATTPNQGLLGLQSLYYGQGLTIK